jgi:ATP-dependent helicase/nuclease subunit B
MGLTASEDVLAQDRFLFYQLLASTAEHVYLTCPRFSDDIELLASTFLASLKDAAPVQTGNDTLLEVFAQTSATFSAYLSANLKSGLAAEQLEWFKDWLVVTSQPAATYWLTGVDNAYRKLNRSGRNRHEGNLQDSPVAVQLLQQTFAAKPFSITALESYAFCPMQYFLNRILQLEEEEEIEAEITALEKGSLVHRILFRFYTESADKKSILNPDEPLGLLLKIAKEEFDRLPYSGLLWTLEKEIYFGREGVPGLWEKFIDLERAEISASGFHPAHFEVAFGRAGGGRYQDPLSSPRPVTIQQRDKKVRLVGKIDRVDINQLQQCFIFDYKISSRVDNITIEDLYQGSSLQLPVYLHVIGRLLPEVVPVAAGYYQVRDADHCQRYTVFADSGGQTGRFDKIKVKTLLPVKIEGEEITLDYLIRRSLDFVIDYTENISRGKFYHTNQPEDARCQNYCPYNKICRKDVAKLKALTASAEN